MTAQNALLEGALYLASQGWAVIPLHHVEDGRCSCGKESCESWGKHPRQTGWQEKATTDPDAIREWWARWPRANIGVPCGQKFGKVMLGPDGERGVLELNALEAELGELPSTVRQASGTPPGFHLIFRAPEGLKIPTRKNHRGYSIDVRGEGGQFVVAPSRNICGDYAWISPPDKMELAILPPAWAEWLASGESSEKVEVAAAEAIHRSALRGMISAPGVALSVEQRARLYLANCPAAVSGQSGHNVAFAVIRSIVYGFDLGPDRGYEVLQEWNAGCRPPWTEAELRHKCKDAHEKPYSKPRGWLLGEVWSQEKNSRGAILRDSRDCPDSSQESLPWEPLVVLPELPDVDPFPLHVFPEEAQRFAAEVSWALNCPVDFVATPMLGVVAGAVGNSRRVCVTGSHYQPAVMFVCVIGAPGSGKSPALSLATDPLEEVQREEMARYYREKANCGEDDDKPLPPTRWLVDDTTQEALVKLLSENPRGMLMVRDELAALIKGMDQYRSGGKGNDRQNFLKLWSQETIRNDRKHNPDGCPVTVYRPFLAVVGGTQPTVVSTLRGETRKGEEPPDDGLVDRFLFSYPVCPAAAGETWREVSLSAREEWERMVRQLLEMEMVGDLGHRTAMSVHLTDDAKDAWSRFTDRHAAETNDEDFPDNLKGIWAKLRGYCARLALAIHCLREASGDRCPHGLDGESMNAGAALVAYFKSHARKVLVAMDADRVLARARRVLRWVSREQRSEFKRWEVFGDLRSRAHFPRPESLDPPLARLVKLNYLRIRHSERGVRGRPEADVYEVHPELLRNNPVYPGNPVKAPPDIPDTPPEVNLRDSRDCQDGSQGDERLPE